MDTFGVYQNLWFVNDFWVALKYFYLILGNFLPMGAKCCSPDIKIHFGVFYVTRFLAIFDVCNFWWSIHIFGYFWDA